MGKKLFLKKERLKRLFDLWKERYILYLPYLKGGVVQFQIYNGIEPFFERPSNLPPKGILFPQCERLFSFSFKKEDGKRRIELKEEKDFHDAIIFGLRPCDARGFLTFDAVFLGDEPKDPYYLERRQKTFLFTLSCSNPTPSCFCTAVGSGPDDKEGSDAIMIELEEGYFIETITERIEPLLTLELFEEGSAFEDLARKRLERTKELIRKPFDVSEIKIDAHLFEDQEFWKREVSKCLSCGVCTYLCPTCYCFNITDEKGFEGGERIRTWDSCMFFHYTLEASGHNPRPTKFDRFKNRVGHKFYYFPERYAGKLSCCGCGRCIRFCPVSVDISEIVAKLIGKGERK